MDYQTLECEDIKLAYKENVLTVCLDQKDSKVNTLSKRLMPEFEKIIAALESDSEVKAVLITSGKKDCFIAGADINDLRQKKEEEVWKLSLKGQEIFSRLASLQQVVIAAIDGACLGGGLELALSCDYRLASETKQTKLGLPEVLLGLLPGAGGTQRLPKLVGLEKSLTMMLTGMALSPRHAKSIGLVDLLTHPSGFQQKAFQLAKDLAKSGKKIKRPQKPAGLMGFLEKTPFGPSLILRKARQGVMAKTRGLYPAPLTLLDVVSFALGHGSKQGFAKEAKEFSRLSQTHESASLISLFDAQTLLKKNPSGSKNYKEVHRIGVLGSGLMGAGISLVSLLKGLQVRMRDLDYKSLVRGQAMIYKDLNRRCKKKRMTAFERDKIFSRLSVQTDLSHFSNCQLLIEAVFEDLSLKHKVLKEIEAVTGDELIFASNTSALPISKIAEVSKRPERVLGMHYFSPVEKMPLLEIIITDKTDEESQTVARKLGQKQGKTVIVVKDGPGFYTTRILCPYMDEVAELLKEGVSFSYLDKLMQELGFPVGPVTLIDEVGLDVAIHVVEDLGKAFGPRVSSQDTSLLKALAKKGCLGRKSGHGFYLYEKNPKKKKEKKIANPLALHLLREAKTVSKKLPSKEEIQKRLVYRMVNEAAMCLQEEIIARPEDGDIGAVFGLGFPPIHGGPFRYLDFLGPDQFTRDMNSFADSYGERFKPAGMILDLAKAKKKVYASEQ